MVKGWFWEMGLSWFMVVVVVVEEGPLQSEPYLPWLGR